MTESVTLAFSFCPGLLGIREGPLQPRVPSATSLLHFCCGQPQTKEAQGEAATQQLWWRPWYLVHQEREPNSKAESPKPGGGGRQVQPMRKITCWREEEQHKCRVNPEEQEGAQKLFLYERQTLFSSLPLTQALMFTWFQPSHHQIHPLRSFLTVIWDHLRLGDHEFWSLRTQSQTSEMGHNITGPWAITRSLGGFANCRGELYYVGLLDHFLYHLSDRRGIHHIKSRGAVCGRKPGRRRGRWRAQWAHQWGTADGNWQREWLPNV